jgi:hypothetical protein
MTIKELLSKLSKYRDSNEVMIHDEKLLIEAHRGKEITQLSDAGNKLGVGVASQWIDLEVPNH